MSSLIESPKRKIILRSGLPPGDLVMLSAAIRDLHRCHPGRFVTDVRSNCPDIWENNPDITPFADSDPASEAIDCHYPLVFRANRLPVHFIEGYIQYLTDKLGVPIWPTEFRGRIELSNRERNEVPMVGRILGGRIPYWIIDAGGKFDFTIKWWSTARWQEVVRQLRDEVLFVQVGLASHFHPRLDDVLDLRGLTTMRELIHLVYFAEGVVCPVTALMHLAAAVPRPDPRAGLRPCVVVAGGREPTHWIAYPGHQVLHKIGALSCCASGGCWRARTVPLGDGHEFDRPDQLCVDVVDGLPRCMAMIRPEQVVEAVRDYLKGGTARALGPEDRLMAADASKLSRGTAIDPTVVIRPTARLAMQRAAGQLGEYPGGYEGRGVVISVARWDSVAPAGVLLAMLRRTGCSLPIEIWLSAPGMPVSSIEKLFEEFGVGVVSSRQRLGAATPGLAHPWTAKLLAIAGSRFREIVYYEPEQVPLEDPARLFDDPNYRETGAIFWPDREHLTENHPMWAIAGVPFGAGPKIQGGEAVLDKARAWKPLQLCRWFGEKSQFFGDLLSGGKDALLFAFRKLDIGYRMPPHEAIDLGGALVQHDFEGHPCHQLRIEPKWSVSAPNPQIPGFRLHEECLDVLIALRCRAEKLGVLLDQGRAPST